MKNGLWSSYGREREFAKVIKSMCEGLSETFRRSVARYFHFFLQFTQPCGWPHVYLFSLFFNKWNRGGGGEVRGACFLTHRSPGFIIFRLTWCTIEQVLSLAEPRNRWQFCLWGYFVRFMYLSTVLSFLLLTLCYALHVHSWRPKMSENIDLNVRIS